jgi:hypothetical protein
MDAIQKAAKTLAQLSDAEWLQVKSAEDRRRADQHVIRDLARELRDRRVGGNTETEINGSAAMNRLEAGIAVGRLPT